MRTSGVTVSAVGHSARTLGGFAAFAAIIADEGRLSP